MTRRTPKNRRTSAPLHRRLLAVGLVAGVSTVGVASAAHAAPVTVSAGNRAPVSVVDVSPAALPTALDTTSSRRTSTVTITL